MDGSEAHIASASPPALLVFVATLDAATGSPPVANKRLVAFFTFLRRVGSGTVFALGTAA